MPRATYFKKLLVITKSVITNNFQRKKFRSRKTNENTVIKQYKFRAETRKLL